MNYCHTEPLSALIYLMGTSQHDSLAHMPTRDQRSLVTDHARSLSVQGYVLSPCLQRECKINLFSLIPGLNQDTWRRISLFELLNIAVDQQQVFIKMNDAVNAFAKCPVILKKKCMFEEYMCLSVIRSINNLIDLTVRILSQSEQEFSHSPK